MNKSALHVMRTFYPNIIMAYGKRLDGDHLQVLILKFIPGQSDEYSFIIRRLAYFFNRRSAKITSLITSAFTSAFVFYWPSFFNSNQNKSGLHFRPYSEWNPSATFKSPPTTPNWTSVPLKYPPSFDGRAVLYPNERTLTDYLRWRQVDCHINNLYNTTFYALTGEYTRYVPIETNSQTASYNLFLGDPSDVTSGRTFLDHGQATNKLSGTSSGDKNEIMFTDYGVNYNDEPQQFRKGTAIVLSPPSQNSKSLEVAPPELPLESVVKPSKSTQKKVAKVEEAFGQLAIEEQERFFTTLHCDIIKEDGPFWQSYGHLLKL